MLSIRFTPKAADDLKDIDRYIAHELLNPQAAADTRALIVDKVTLLGSYPNIGTRLKASAPALRIYRYIQCSNYLVFYRVDVSHVSIIRILYAKRNYLAILEADWP